MASTMWERGFGPPDMMGDAADRACLQRFCKLYKRKEILKQRAKQHEEGVEPNDSAVLHP